MAAVRSRVHMFLVAAARLEADRADAKLIGDLRAAGEAEAAAVADGRGWTEADERRVERQRTRFAELADNRATDRLKQWMLQRIYDLMWDGRTEGADALAEFLPSADLDRLFAAWESDQLAKTGEALADWHEGQGA